MKPAGQILSDSPKAVKSYWVNFSDAINAADANKYNVSDYVTQSYSKSHAGGSFEEAVRLAREGWPEGAQKVSSIIESLNVTGNIALPELYFDVQGEYGFDAGRIASGEPECMMSYRDSDDETIQSDKPQNIRMLLNRASSWGIESEAAVNRGSAILGLIEALELSGRSVELWTVDACMLGNKHCDIYIQAKAAGEPLQVDKIAFAVLHPAYERRIAFSLIGLQGPTGNVNAKDGNFGWPCTALDVSDFNIYFDRMSSLDTTMWNDKASVIAWCRARLMEFGVTLA